MNEYISYRILFMLSHGFNKVVVNDNDGYVIADEKYMYPLCWLENDYIFYNKICRKVGYAE